MRENKMIAISHLHANTGSIFRFQLIKTMHLVNELYHELNKEIIIAPRYRYNFLFFSG